MSKSELVFRDLAPLVRVAGFAVWTQVVCSCLSFVSDGFDLRMRSSLAGLNLSTEEFDQSMILTDLRQGLLSLVTMVVIIVTAVIVLRCIYRADKNLHARGVDGLEFTPGWCVGWHFVPIACLWKPYQALKEIWLASHDPVQFSIARSGLFPAWWTLLLISNFTGTSSARLAIMHPTAESQIESIVLSMISTAASIPEALIILVLLRQIAAAQECTLKVELTFG